MPYAGTLLGGEVQTQSMQPPSFIEKALRRLPSSWAVGQNDIQKRRATRTTALYSIRLNRTTSINEERQFSRNRQQIANSLSNAPECTYPKKYHVQKL